MATSIEEILGKSISSTKELKDEINRLRDALVQAEEGTSDWEDSAKKLNAAQEKLSSVTAAGKRSIDAASDSIVGMEQEYKSLYNTYKLLTEEQRNSDFGKQMTDSLETLSQKLNETKKGVGNFKDNIGHYCESAMEAFSKMGISVGGLAQPMALATAASKGLGASLKALIANPVGAVIMAIVVAFKALAAIVDRVKTAIAQNEETQMKLKVAMSAFKPVIDAITNAFDGLATIVVGVIESLAGVFNAIRKFGAKISDKLGITDDAVANLEKTNELYTELAKRENDLIKRKREEDVLNEKDAARVSDLRQQAEETRNLAEKQQLLNEAAKTQATLDDRKIKLAQDELDLLKKKAELSPNSAADNDALAAAQKEVNTLTKEAADRQRELTGAIKGATDAANSQAAALAKVNAEIAKRVKDAADAVEKEIAEAGMTNIEKTIAKLTEEYRRAKKVLEDAGRDTAALTEYYTEEIAKAAAEADAESAKKAYEEIQKLLKQDFSNTTATLNLKLTQANQDKDYDAAYAIQQQMQQAELDYYDKRKEALENYLSRLEGIEGTEEERESVQQQLFENQQAREEALLEFKQKQMEAEENLKALETERNTALLDSFSSLKDSLADNVASYQALLKAQMDSGKYDEKQTKKKEKLYKALQKVQTAVAIGSVVADTASGIMSTWKGYAAELAGNAETAGAAGPAFAAVKAALDAKSLITAITNTASLAASGAAQISAIRANHISNVSSMSSSDSSTASVSATPTTVETDPYTYTRTLQTEEEETSLNSQYYVLVKDIEDGLSKVNVREKETSF